jgi:long-chain fatty acid transport protein
VNTRLKIIFLFSTAIASMLFVGAASATNGYLTHGVGTKNKSMAGAGTALPQDAIDVANNPAGAAVIGKHKEVGLSFFSPMRDYTSSESLANGQGGAFTIGPNSLSSNNELFFIPTFAMSWELSEQNSLVLALYGRGGMNTQWKGGTATFDPDGPGPAPVGTFPGTYGAGTAGVDLAQAFFNLTFGRSTVDETFSWGVSAIAAAQRFKAQGVGSFAGFTETFASSGGTQQPVNLSDNGSEWSFGGGVAGGVLWQPVPQFSLGARYTSKMYMSKFDKYADLFAESGGFDVPANASIGIAYKPVENLTLAFDVEQIWYSDIDSVGNPIQNLFSCPTAGQGGTDLSSCLGGNNGGGFGWDDMTIFKLGVQYETNGPWTWRGGISYGEQPIGSDQMTFNILAPGIMETHLTAGFTRKQSDTSEWNLSFMYAPEKKVSGLNSFDPTQTIELKMQQVELEISYGWK